MGNNAIKIIPLSVQNSLTVSVRCEEWPSTNRITGRRISFLFKNVKKNVDNVFKKGFTGHPNHLQTIPNPNFLEYFE